MAVKTCKKNCTLDNKEKFMSEAGRCPWGDTSTGAKKSQETMQTGKQEGVKASAVEVGEAVDRVNIHRGERLHPWLSVQPADLDSCFGPWKRWSTYPYPLVPSPWHLKQNLHPNPTT